MPKNREEEEEENMSSYNSNKATKYDKQVEFGGGKGNEEVEEEKEETMVNVTTQLLIKPIENCKNLDREVVLRRIRHRKRMNKVRAIFLGSTNNNGDGESSLQQKRWLDDAFAAL